HLREREYLTLVRVLITQRKLDEAMTWLGNLLQLAEAQGRMGSVIEILMLQAEVLQACGEVKQAMERLSRALLLAEPEGYIRLFVDEGVPIAPLLIQIRDQQHSGQRNTPERIPLEYIKTLLAASATSSSQSGPQPHGLVEPLSERELEV